MRTKTVVYFHISKGNFEKVKKQIHHRGIFPCEGSCVANTWCGCTFYKSSSGRWYYFEIWNLQYIKINKYPGRPSSQVRSKTRWVLIWDSFKMPLHMEEEWTRNWREMSLHMEEKSAIAYGREIHLSWPSTSVKSFEPPPLPRTHPHYKNQCHQCPVLHLWKLHHHKIYMCVIKFGHNSRIFCHTFNDSNAGQECDVLDCL